ncbi:Phosphoserine phosphatase 1 [Pontiella desulfatans]|uniref:Phosphoserine phosphatase 1 n=2 Tax=Pontiella desulfatans TaxID=2750659 RepID=A0A6C2U9D7_PONDE|nr:Phosphoserine phosphatase 1 [Pontiella desulfatans]
MKTILYLIRHGQTQWNAERRMQGRSDSPLTEKGIRMAERLADGFPPVDAVYASPQGRARRTAEIIFGNREIQTDDRLREIDLGEWEGRLQAELDIDDAEQHSNFWKSPHRFAPQTGETFECVHRRAAACLHDLAARHDGESIALVSHTTVIRSMLFSIEERPLADFWNPPAVYPASVSEVHVEDGQFKIARFGDIAHYGPDSRPSGAY